MLFLLQIFGKHINLFFLLKDIKHLVETIHIERLNNTLRQRIARLVRKTLFKKTRKPYWSYLVFIIIINAYPDINIYSITCITLPIILNQKFLNPDSDNDVQLPNQRTSIESKLLKNIKYQHIISNKIGQTLSI